MILQSLISSIIGGVISAIFSAFIIYFFTNEMKKRKIKKYKKDIENEVKEIYNKVNKVYNKVNNLSSESSKENHTFECLLNFGGNRLYNIKYKFDYVKDYYDDNKRISIYKIIEETKKYMEKKQNKSINIFLNNCKNILKK